MNTEISERIDVRSQLGNPKITFVTGAPGSGKGTQCEKLVEEFNYKHISVGDLIRQEINKGTRDGDRLKQFVEQGKNAPLELTVQLLINALIANPSENYLIDGFPREVDQCTYFETNVCEAQNVLFFDCSQDTCTKRLLNRGQGRSDDNAEAIVKRFETYQQKNLPVINYYEQFGKVRRIDANRDVLDIYEETRKAMLPQISCIIGPKASGKTTLGNALCERTNMKLIDFNDFVAQKNLGGCDDETITVALIKHLSTEICPRVLLEDFPQSEFQAKFFIKNCVAPSRVFSLECSKDLCQERMIKLAQTDSSYQASSILSKRVRQYNENARKLLPYLKQSTNLRNVNTEQKFDQAFQQLCAFVEPTVLLVRTGGGEEAHLRRIQIIESLKSTKGFNELNVFQLIKEETERHTEIGREINQQISAGKDYQRDLDNLIVRMLKKIIYSGIDGRDKFILTDFPDTIKQAQEFEDHCAKITAVIFSAAGESNSSFTEIIDNGLSIESIDSLLEKEHRIKTMYGWDESTFNDHLGNKTEYAIIIGAPLSGKSTVARIIAENANGKVFEMAKVAEEIRPKLETEEGPFEGRIPDAEVEKSILATIAADKAAGNKFLYIFDGQHHESLQKMTTFMLNDICAPSYYITASADAKEIERRYKEKNEIAEDLTEEDQNNLKQQAANAATDGSNLRYELRDVLGRCIQMAFDTGCSKESLTEEIRSSFCAKVILVNHEKRYDVDIACSNLAIKNNMLYFSVYQMIKKEIAADTELGRALANSRREKALDFGPVAKTVDPFEESQYSAVHFDSTLVMQLVQKKIAENRTTQRYILLEGLCNNHKLESQEQRLQLRFMDEFFAIERNIGEVVGVISLQSEKEATTFDLPNDCYEEVVVEEVKQAAPRTDGGDDEEGEKEDAAPGGDPKVPKWNHKDYRWSVTNGRSKNLPILFRNTKGGVVGKTSSFEEKNWKSFGKNSHGDAAVQALDEFCSKINLEGNYIYLYQQVIFNDLD